MKKILIAIVCILFGVAASAQLQQQSLGGSVTTLSTTQGGLMGKLYFILPKKDTLNNAATGYVGALTVRPQDTIATLYPPIYMSNGHFWISVGSGANGIDSITVSPDSTLYRAYNKGNQIFTFSTLLRNVKAGTNVTFTWDVDTLVINSAAGSVVTDSTQWAVSDSLSTPAVSPNEGTIYLVGLFATGAFSGHENQIATYDSVPAIYSFQSADLGDLLYNANNGVVSVWTGTAWVWVGKLIIHHPNDNYGFGLSLGTLGAFPVAIRTTNTPRITIGANGDVTFNGYTSGHTGTATGTLQVDSTGKVIIGASSSGITALTGDVTASGTGSVAATLATVNSNVGSFTNANITVNGKGLVTAAANGTGNNLQQSIDAGATLNKTNSIDVNSNVLSFDNVGEFYINESSGGAFTSIGNISGTNYLETSNANGIVAIASGVGGDSLNSKIDNTAGWTQYGKTTSTQIDLIPTSVTIENFITTGLGIPHAKLVLKSADTLHTTPTMMYVPDGDTVKVYPYSGGGGGTVTSVSGTANRITSTGGATPVLDISASYVGQSSITTLGTIGTGVWQGTAIGDTYISSASTWNAKEPAITTLSLTKGGTNANLSATGGSKQVLQQASSGAAITVGALDSSFITGVHTQTYNDLRYGTAFPNTANKVQNGYGNYPTLHMDSITNGTTNMYEVSQSTAPTATAGRVWNNTGFPAPPNSNSAFTWNPGLFYSNGTTFAPINNDNSSYNSKWWGDSWAANFGLASANNGFVNKSSYYKGLVPVNGAASGSTMYTLSTFLSSSVDNMFLECGVNEMRLYGYNALQDYLAAVRNFVVYRQSGTIVNGTSGTKTTPADWVADSILFTYTVATRTTVNASPITYTIAGNSVYISTVHMSATDVAYSVTIDGNLKGTFSALTRGYTPSGTDPNSNGTFFCQRFTDLGDSLHTVVLQKTSGTGQFRVIYVASNYKPTVPIGNNGLRTSVLAIGKMTTGTAGVSGYNFWGGSDTLTNTYNTALNNVTYQLANDGLNVNYININKYYNPKTSGYAQADSLHPADAGHTAIARGIIENTASSILPREREVIRYLKDIITTDSTGNVNVTKSLNKLLIATGTNASIGTATLVGGTVTINTTAVLTGSKIQYSVRTPGGTQGFLSAPTASVVNATSFVINSTSGTETSTVDWWIVN